MTGAFFGEEDDRIFREERKARRAAQVSLCVIEDEIARTEKLLKDTQVNSDQYERLQGVLSGLAFARGVIRVQGNI